MRLGEKPICHRFEACGPLIIPPPAAKPHIDLKPALLRKTPSNKVARPLPFWLVLKNLRRKKIKNSNEPNTFLHCTFAITASLGENSLIIPKLATNDTEKHLPIKTMRQVPNSNFI
ncbi:hypothetical protein V6N13_141335 [Hibiscus sabdariffa]